MMRMVNGLIDWVDARLPVVNAYKKHMSEYYAPKNFNFWVLLWRAVHGGADQPSCLTGIWLTVSYSPARALSPSRFIVRDVQWGWLIRYMHAVGASAFTFAVVYLHMFCGLLYGSYKPPRELVWIFGMLIYVALMAEGFLGYVPPWGNMSYWGAQVIISLAGAIPFDILPFIDAKDAKEIGDALTIWVRGDYLLSTATVNKFFALHVVAIPLVLVALVFLHILALHEVGSSNPDGVEIKQNKDENGIPRDGIPFHPYYTVKRPAGRDHLPDHLRRGGVLLPHRRRLSDREAQLRAGGSAQDPGSHRTGVVLRRHLLRHAAGHHHRLVRHVVQGLGPDRHGRRYRGAVPAALAGPSPGQVDSLQRLAQQAAAVRVRRRLPDARLPWHSARFWPGQDPGADRHGVLLCLLLYRAASGAPIRESQAGS